jgi:hypothetical protein
MTTALLPDYEHTGSEDVPEMQILDGKELLTIADIKQP